MTPAKPARRPRVVKAFDPSSAPRCRSRILVEVHVDGRVERGAIADVSASGARIVGPRLDLAPGTPLAIHYETKGGAAPKPLQAEFVRPTEDGFAIAIVRR
jgi:hypothetical protein